MVISKRGLILSTTAMAITTVAVIGAGIHLSHSQSLYSESSKEIVDEVWQIVYREYVDGTFNGKDWRAIRQEYLGRTYHNDEEAYQAIREMLKNLGDPYTRFMDPREFQNMRIDTSGELTGVGIQIRQEEETGKILVESAIEGTPAFRAGIFDHDVILKIDGVTTEGMTLEDAVSKIRGKRGTEVVLTILRETKQGDKVVEEIKEFPIVRDTIQIHPVRFEVIDHNSDLGKIGYIRLNQFSAQASGEMKDAINQLEEKGVKGYVLDLRSNPGGLLTASVDIARMWIDDGTIVSTVNRQGTVNLEAANHQILTNKPLVVLVDGGSASASEILSGALQDHHRAVLVGTKTFGKGLVQSVRELSNSESGVAVTIAKYLTPSGRDINKEGIHPDIISELTEEQRQKLSRERNLIGTFEDPQFVKAFDTLSEEITAQNKPSNHRASH
jgi:carboxyl-terminal processing protease